MIIKVEQHNIYIYGYIYDGDGIYFLREFSTIDGTYPEFEMFIHCYGGSVFDGNMILNTITTAKSNVNTNVIGVGASMGAILLQAGKKRRQVSNGFTMIHAATGGTYGTAQDHLNHANLLTEMEKQFIQTLVQKTGKKPKQVKQWLVGDNWFSAEQALANGLIDEIIDPLAILDIDINDPQEMGSEEIYNRFAASLKIEDKKRPSALKKEIIPPKQQQITTQINIDTMKQDVIQALGLTGVNAQSSDTAVIGAIQQHVNAQSNDYKAKYEKEKTARENLETAVNAQRDAQITALLDKAEKVDKTITAAQRTEVYEPIGKNAGIKSLETVLAGLTPRVPIAAQVSKGGVTPVADQNGWNWDRYQKENPNALETMRKDNPDAFSALFKAKYGVDYTE
ncbi:Clp protease ClpP [Aquimarina algiphila]|uniref:Clp protease ClpP n=1 Tax=Aquimarina algiphila TaxID=2047982 RepID=UPI0023313A6A|nr:Clp protease ClpP [Aquimarina algiphila]